MRRLFDLLLALAAAVVLAVRLSSPGPGPVLVRPRGAAQQAIQNSKIPQH